MSGFKFKEISQGIFKLNDRNSKFIWCWDKTYDPTPDPLNTFTGKIIRFISKAVKPFVKIEAAFSPVQDLNGYDNPWPPGGGKNLCPVAQDSRNPFMIWGAGQNDLKTAINGLSAGTYTITIKYKIVQLPASGSVGYGMYATKSGGTLIGYSVTTDNSPTVGKVYSVSKTFTLAEADVGTVTNFYLYCDSSSTHSGTSEVRGLYNAYDFQIESGNRATDFAPYSNICPISGHTGATVYRTGKNLLAKPFAFRPVQSQFSDCFFIKAGTYTFSFDSIATATSWRFGISMFDKDGNELSANKYIPHNNTAWVASVKMWYWAVDVSVKTITLTFVEDCFTRIWFGSGNTSSDMVATGAQLELGSSATDYEAFSGDSVVVTFGQTVYSGTLDVVSGELTLTHGIITANGTESWTKPDNCFKTESLHADSDYPQGISNTYKVATSYSAVNGNNNRIAAHSTWFRIHDERFSTTDAFKTYLSENNVQFVYELATPITIPLSADGLTTLGGENVVFSNLNGDLEVTAYGTPIG